MLITNLNHTQEVLKLACFIGILFQIILYICETVVCVRYMYFEVLPPPFCQVSVPAMGFDIVIICPAFEDTLGE